MNSSCVKLYVHIPLNVTKVLLLFIWAFPKCVKKTPFGAGFSLQVLAPYGRSGLFATIPNAKKNSL